MSASVNIHGIDSRAPGMMPLCFCLLLLSEMSKVPAAYMTSGITQDNGIRTAEVGKTEILQCFFREDVVTFLSWYQQSLGSKPQIIATRMKHDKKASISPEFQERFQVIADGKEGTNHLEITDIRLTDSATYYCGILEFNAIEFGQGVFLHVRTTLSNVQAVIRQPALESLQPGGSVNLSCTVFAEKCAGEESVYWFRHGGAQPAVMYQNSVKQCVTDAESHTKNCTLNLTIKSMNSSNEGTYYCALASCGEIVFGNGTQLKIARDPTKVSHLLVYCLSVALAASIVLLLVLAFMTYKLKKKLGSLCKGSASHQTCSAASDSMQSQGADVLHYAALNLNRRSERHRQEESMESACVYSRVKSRKEWNQEVGL